MRLRGVAASHDPKHFQMWTRLGSRIASSIESAAEEIIKAAILRVKSGRGERGCAACRWRRSMCRTVA
jgi:hypothetical protein